MKPVDFLSNSPQVAQISKGLILTQSLQVSSIIMGEPYTGKKSLVATIYPKLISVDGRQPEALMHALKQHDALVLYHAESIPNLSRFDFTNKRIIAISDQSRSNETIEEKFAFIYHMPALRDRPEDIILLMTHFCKQIKEELMIDKELTIDPESLDLSENIKSFKASLYRALVTADLGETELETLIYKYLYPRLEGNNAYRDHIGILERPMIKAGLDRYRSQLKLSSILGLNRNTLRKKIHEHYLD